MYDKPEKVTSGIPDKFKASKNEKDLKYDTIPLPAKGEWLTIGFYDYPGGNAKVIWKNVNNRIAALEREANRKEKNNEPISRLSIAVQIEELYLEGSTEFSVKELNGTLVTPESFQFELNDDIRKILMQWRKSHLDGDDYPVPAWAKPPEDETDSKNLTSPSTPPSESVPSYGETVEGDTTERIE